MTTDDPRYMRARAAALRHWLRTGSNGQFENYWKESARAHLKTAGVEDPDEVATILAADALIVRPTRQVARTDNTSGSRADSIGLYGERQIRQGNELMKAGAALTGLAILIPLILLVSLVIIGIISAVLQS